jgi:hypothetical protein
MRTLLLGLMLLLAACVPRVDRRLFLDTLVGQPETEVIRQRGVPIRTYESGGHKFIAYLDQRSTILYGGPMFGGGFYGGGFYGGGFGYDAFPTEVVRRSCETTFEIANGRVQTYALRGNDCF